MASPPLNLQSASLAEIRAIMARTNTTKAQLAEKLGVQRHWIYERLSGNVRLTVDDLERICLALGIDPDMLITDATAAVSRG